MRVEVICNGETHRMNVEPEDTVTIDGVKITFKEGGVGSMTLPPGCSGKKDVSVRVLKDPSVLERLRCGKHQKGRAHQCGSILTGLLGTAAAASWVAYLFFNTGNFWNCLLGSYGAGVLATAYSGENPVYFFKNTLPNALLSFGKANPE